MHHGSDALRNDAGLRPGSTLARQAAPVLLVATAVFLIVVILARTPLSGFVVSQSVRAASDRATTTAPLATEQVISWLKSDAVLASVVQQTFPKESLAGQQHLIQDLQGGLDVQPDASRPSLAGWRLTIQHRDRQLASRLLGALSQSLTTQLKQLDQAEAQMLVQHYQKTLLAARDEEDLARQSLERARHEELTVARQTSPNQPSLVSPMRSPSPLRPNLNPAWQDLQVQVNAAKAKLEQLLTNRTNAHPHVIEAQAQVTTLEDLLNQTPRESGGQVPQSESLNHDLNGPQLRESAQQQARVSVRLISTAEDIRTSAAQAAGDLDVLSARWSSAATKRANVERSWNEAQQQWVRGLNVEGWNATPVWTEAQFGGRATNYQLLLAAVLACTAGLGAWRLTYLAARDGALTTAQQLAATLPLPVLGAVPLTTDFPKRQHERVNTQVARLSQLSLAVIASVLLVVAWVSSIDTSLSAQWSSDPCSALGQAFDLLHHRLLG